MCKNTNQIIFLKIKSKGFSDISIYKIDRFVGISYYFLMTSNFFVFFVSKKRVTNFYLSKETELLCKLRNPALKDYAFNELLDTYQERLYWHIRKIVITHENASDVLQNTFIRVYKNIQNFQEKSSLHTWMFRIAYNESIRYLEKNNKKGYETSEEFIEEKVQILSEDAYFNGDDIQLKLHKIIESFSEKQKRVFQMKYFDELSFKEISELTKVSESTLKSMYYSSVKIIEEKIFL